jgi:uncharacterized coiled-coil protein SlyX
MPINTNRSPQRRSCRKSLPSSSALQAVEKRTPLRCVILTRRVRISVVSLFGLLLAAASADAFAQAPAPSPADTSNAQLEQKIETIANSLAATQQQIEQSQRQMQQLQQQLLELRQQMSSAGAAPASAPAAQPALASEPSSATPATTASIEERQQTLEAAVKLHDQTKVESTSKYPVRVNGLILFNSYLNRGVTDNSDLPAFALRSTATSGNGNMGASFRQTILGLEGDGPTIAGAHTSANVSFDFFSSVSYTSYGTSAGTVRMRTAGIDFDWANDSIQLGMVSPLISPISPTSYATVAEPSLAGAGNLWTWAPQLRYAHRFPVHDGNQLQLEFGLWDSPAAGYNANQLFRTSSPGELAQQPAYESRISYGPASSDRGLQLGLGGYYSRQAYPGYQGYLGTEHNDSWAVTTDFRIPLGRRIEISGEGYRGRSIAGLGGGVYKDIITGTSPASGTPALHGLNAIGGWTQFKTRYSSTLETNFSIGLDDGFARDFHAVVLPSTAGITALRARNKMAVANLIFRPKTYIILSPEYRRIWSYPITGLSSTLDVYTLSAGFQF